jgi:hypothetical protein
MENIESKVDDFSNGKKWVKKIYKPILYPVIGVLLVINTGNFLATRNLLREGYQQTEIEESLEQPCYLKDGRKMVGASHIVRLGKPSRLLAYLIYDRQKSL